MPGMREGREECREGGREGEREGGRRGGYIESLYTVIYIYAHKTFYCIDSLHDKEMRYTHSQTRTAKTH